MAAPVASLKAHLTLETGQFEAGAKRARRTAKTTGDSIKSSFAGVGKSIAGGLTAGLSVGILAGLAKKALDYAGSLGEVAQQIGVTTRDLQVFRYAAGQTGIKQEQLEKGLQKLTITLGQVATGAKAPTKALNAIGISADQLKGKDTGEAFRIIADGLARVTDRSQRAAVEVALFGRSGAQLDNLLSGGSKAINELSQAADKLGIVLSDEQIQKADETADKLEAVRTVLAAQIAGTVAANANSILGLASALGQLTSQVIRFLGSNPQLALAIIGGLAGARFGIAGAAGGALAGGFAGAKVKASADAANNDLGFRAKQLRAANAELKRKRALYGGNAPPATYKDAADRVRREIQLTKQAMAASKAARNPPPVVPGVDVSNFLASGGGGGKKSGGRDTSERDRLNALRDAYSFNQDMRRSEMDILRAKQDLATNVDERAALEIQMLDLDKAGQQAELDYQVATGDLSKAQAEQLKAKYETVDALKRQAIAEDLAADKAHDAAQLRDTDYDLQIEALQLQSDLATTQKEKRAVELRILDAMEAQERARLETVLADQQSSTAAKAEAQMRLNALNANAGAKREQVMRDTAGPLESAKLQFGDIADEMEQLKVDGIMGAVDALTQLTDGFGSFRDAAISAIKQVIAEFIRLQLLKAAFSIIGGGMGGGAGGSIAGGMAGGNITLPGFATGGGFSVMGNRGVDRNLLQLNGLPIARVSHGERVSISNDNQRMAGNTTVNFALSGPVSRETMGQIAAKTKLAIASANRKGM